MDGLITDMKISSFLKEEFVKLDVETDEKFTLLKNLSNMLSSDDRVVDSDQLAADIEEREKIETTGIGEGIAIPHARTNSVTDIIILMARLSGAVDYGSIDGKPVKIIFLIGTPKDAVQSYLKLLANLTKLVKEDSVRKQLTTAATPSEVLDIIREHEQD